jgi:hypothetical protein
MMRLYEDTKASIAIFDVYLYKVMLAYLFGDFREARRNGKQAGQLAHRAMGNSYILVYHFYNTLTTLALAEPLPGRAGNSCGARRKPAWRRCGNLPATTRPWPSTSRNWLRPNTAG